MADQYDDTNRIVLFINDKGDNPNRPDLQGNVNMDGTEKRVSLWKRESKNGGTFFSGELSEKREGTPDSSKTATGRTAAPENMSPAVDDDLPF